MRQSLLFLVCVVLAAPRLCDAGDLSDEAYLLRFAAALRRASGFAPAAALQASAAHAAGWSVNPAADDVLRTGDDAPLRTTLTHQHIFTESGAWFTDTSITASLYLPSLGTIPLAFARTDTIDGQTNSGLSNILRSNEFFWGYSRSLSDSTAVGIQARFLTAEFEEETLAGVTPFPTRFETDVRSIDFTVGLRWSPFCSDWAFGVLGGFSWGWADTDAENMVPLNNPFPPPPTIPVGTLLFSTSDTIDSQFVRFGAGYAVSDWAAIYADGEYYHIGSDLGGTLDLARAVLGLELRRGECTTIRLGAGIDSQAESTLSAGIGHELSERLALQGAYQYNNYPEIRRELGVAHVVMVSGVWLF